MHGYYVITIDCVDDSALMIKTWETKRAYEWFMKNNHDGISGVVLEIHEVTPTTIGRHVEKKISYYYNDDAYNKIITWREE